ncbi:MAG: bifunctional aminodeoxychorismate synthase component I/aminotransferase, partial [Rhodoferax sp.]
MQTLIDFARTGAEGGNTPVRCAFGAPNQTLVAHTPAQVRPLLDAVQALAGRGRWCVGYLRYEAGAAFDPALAVHQADGPLAWFGVHDAPQPWPEGEAGGTATAQWHESLTRTAFDQGMAEIHRAIAGGELYQLNYTAPLHGVMQGAPRDLFMALRRAQPGGGGEGRTPLPPR